MRLLIQAEDGDLLTVAADQLGCEQGLVRVHLDNRIFQQTELDSFSLSFDQARKLAHALLSASLFVENFS